MLYILFSYYCGSTSIGEFICITFCNGLMQGNGILILINQKCVLWNHIFSNSISARERKWFDCSENAHIWPDIDIPISIFCNQICFKRNVFSHSTEHGRVCRKQRGSLCICYCVYVFAHSIHAQQTLFLSCSASWTSRKVRKPTTRTAHAICVIANVVYIFPSQAISHYPAAMSVLANVYVQLQTYV